MTTIRTPRLVTLAPVPCAGETIDAAAVIRDPREQSVLQVEPAPDPPDELLCEGQARRFAEERR